MRTHRLYREEWLPPPVEDAFAFFSPPENLEEITPPLLRFHIVSAEPELHRGSLIGYKLRIRGVPMGWVSEIAAWDPPNRFVDTQLRALTHCGATSIASYPTTVVHASPTMLN